MNLAQTQGLSSSFCHFPLSVWRDASQAHSSEAWHDFPRDSVATVSPFESVVTCVNGDEGTAVASVRYACVTRSVSLILEFSDLGQRTGRRTDDRNVRPSDADRARETIRKEYGG